MSAGAVAAGGTMPMNGAATMAHQKQQAGHDGRDAGAAARGHARRGLHVAGHGGGSGQRAEDGGRGVGKQNAVQPRNGVVGRDEPGALGHGHQRAQVVEEVDKEEDEDDLEQALVERAANVELERGLGQRAASRRSPASSAPSAAPRRCR